MRHMLNRRPESVSELENYVGMYPRYLNIGWCKSRGGLDVVLVVEIEIMSTCSGTLQRQIWHFCFSGPVTLQQCDMHAAL